MAGFAQAVDRLGRAVRTGELVGIFGDYDVDGVTATAVLTSFLRGIGGRVVRRVARRDAGYGFGEDAAAWFAGEGCRVVVTVDCGTSDHPAILFLRGRGIDTIVVDHHQVPPSAEHPAFSLLNPHRADSSYPFRGLASVGLAFFLAAALRTALRAAGWFDGRAEPDPRDLLDLVAVGTIADLAPLTDENRVLVQAGLRELGRRRRPGMAALLEACGIAADRPLVEADIGWKLGPRLNAPGRLGDAEPALALLLAETPAEATAAAAACEDANVRRRALQEQMVAEAIVEAEAAGDRAAIVVARLGWHPGVAGIVAAKLVERLKKPAAVIALGEDGQGRGSVRTLGGFDVYRALAACRDKLIRYGGHAQAAGLTVAAENVAALRDGFAALAEAETREAAGLDVDAVTELGEVTGRLAEEIAALAPFGPGNAAPILAAPGARVRESRRVGDGSHLKLTLACGRHATEHAAIGFRLGELDPGVGATIDVAYRPELSEWRGEKRLELNVCAIVRSGCSGEPLFSR
jgi:single-stranded-DNA-specific exonuclease